MRLIKWGLGGLALFVASAVVAFGVVSLSGDAEAQAKPGFFGRYEEVLAEKLGISVEKLQEAQKAARGQLLDEAVQNGRLTQEQADRLKNAQPGAGPGFHGFGPGGPGAFMGPFMNVFAAAADVLKMSPADLREALKTKSLAQIAEDRKVSRGDLEKGITDAVTAEVKKAVDSKNLTQDQADKILAGLKDRLDAIIDHVGGGPKAMPFGQRGGQQAQPSPTPKSNN